MQSILVGFWIFLWILKANDGSVVTMNYINDEVRNGSWALLKCDATFYFLYIHEVVVCAKRSFLYIVMKCIFLTSILFCCSHESGHCHMKLVNHLVKISRPFD